MTPQRTARVPGTTLSPTPRRFLRCIACGTVKKERPYALCAECWLVNGTLPAAWFGRWARLAEREGALVILPWALPGTVLAIALATTFSADQPLAGRFVWVGTFMILPLAYFIRNVPLVTRAALASFRQFDPVLEEASASLGAGWATTMRRVALPLIMPGLAAGASLAFVAALGEFVASILLYTHRTRPISMAILSELRAFNFGAAAAYGVLLIVLMALVFLYGYRSLNEERPGVS